jgi:hypothetical protein
VTTRLGSDMFARLLSVGSVVGCLVAQGAQIAPQASGSTTDVTASWARAWPMLGHDPQRTSRSPMVGPVHPHLLFTVSNISLSPVIGPDGTVYTWRGTGLTALDTSGRQRWTYPAFAGDAGGPPALAPNGTLVAVGYAFSQPGPGVAQSTVFGIASGGHLAWKMQPAAFQKGASSLATASNELYLPFVGPTSDHQELDVLSTNGAILRQVHRGTAFLAVALATSGSIYATVKSADTSFTPYLAAFRATGQLRWSHPAGYDRPTVNLLVGLDGTIYAGDPSGVLAYTPSGHLRWKRRVRGGVMALAQRADGTLVAAGSGGVTAVSSRGKALWHRKVPAAQADAPYSVVVDAAGTTYCGAGDGSVWVISEGGKLLTRLPSSTTASGIGPDGNLYVIGHGGTLQVYGP